MCTVHILLVVIRTLKKDRASSLFRFVVFILVSERKEIYKFKKGGTYFEKNGFFFERSFGISLLEIRMIRRKVKSMQRSGTEAIGPQIQPSKEKREITNITNSQNT